MSSPAFPLHWNDLHWPDLADGAPPRLIAVLPLAATEQHGPHLPLGTDVMIAEAYLARVRDLLPKDLFVTFLPVQPVGISTEHINFPGTMSLPTELALQTWLAIGEGLARIGIRKMVIVTSHGGNSAAMSLVAQDLRARFGMMVVTTSWNRFGTPDGIFPDDELRHGIHGGAIETSIMLAANPDKVRSERIADFVPASVRINEEYHWLSTTRPAAMAWQAEDLHPSGVAGNATLASAEKGEQLIAHGAAAFCELLEEVDDFDIERIETTPDPTAS